MLSFTGAGGDDAAGDAFRAQTPVSAARSLAEAESELESELRSGYRVVVAFERLGEAERAQYKLDRVDPRFLDCPRRATSRRSSCRGAARRRLRLAGRCGSR